MESNTTIWSPIEEVNRNFVMDHMSNNGDRFKRMCPQYWEYAYIELADGFGKIDLDWAIDNCWDWSHIRDSSPKAILKIAQFIYVAVYEKDLVAAKKLAKER